MDPALTAAAIGLGGTVIVGLAGFWANVRNTNKISNLTAQGQLTDRYSKAIEQLGSDKLDVRIGGIYALERIARDSPRDHLTIMEVLAAFIRHHSREQWPPTEPGAEPPERTTRPDIQAAATVIGRRNARHDRQPLNLRHAHLPSADLSGANLTNAGLSGAHLIKAALIKADLTKADLTKADLTKADLTNADLIGADLTSADLSEADLTSTNLAEADLTEAILTGTNLTEAILIAAKLTNAELTGRRAARRDDGTIEEYISRAELTGANLSGAKPHRCSLAYGCRNSGGLAARHRLGPLAASRR